MSRMTAWRACRKAVRLWLERHRQRAAERRALALLQARGDKRLLDEAGVIGCRTDDHAALPGTGGDRSRRPG
ncbi:hypothetical protein OCK02_00045 [Rhizobium sp. TRM96647]|uniref:hypothetical protein n=1 Tax=unclassified Rhizobium TaxID=2613769 RepID=UPI0021E7017D|nr:MULTISPECIES: hypothetical protein [unclassified Rhizobium]MCV3734576.1 hypothetical protein [Rhizobium sp. TRM96647]MCV3756946.1 hypothetical protein [Rhizobium sp. TRM96650]